MGSPAGPVAGRPGCRLALVALVAGLLVPPALATVPATSAAAAAGPQERKAEVDEAARTARADLEQSEEVARRAAERLATVESDLAAARDEVAAAQAALAAARRRDRAAAEELAEAE